MGTILEPYQDFDPHPTMWEGMIRTALEKHGTSNKPKKGGSSKQPITTRRYFPLPIPPPGKKMISGA